MSARGRNGKEPVVRMVGRVQVGFGIAAGANVDTLALNDQLSTQLSSMSDMYGLYRFTRIRFVLPANCQFNSASAPGIYGVGFTPEVLINAPTTLAEAIQMPYWCGHGCNILTGSNVLLVFSTSHQSFTVGRRDLRKTGVTWFRTQGRGTESDWETQGTFVCGSANSPSTSTMLIKGWIEYECEFTDQLPLASTLNHLRTQIVEELASEMEKPSAVSQRGSFRKPPGSALRP